MVTTDPLVFTPLTCSLLSVSIRTRTASLITDSSVACVKKLSTAYFRNIQGSVALRQLILDFRVLTLHLARPGFLKITNSTRWIDFSGPSLVSENSWERSSSQEKVNALETTVVRKGARQTDLYVEYSCICQLLSNMLICLCSVNYHYLIIYCNLYQFDLLIEMRKRSLLCFAFS